MTTDHITTTILADLASGELALSSWDRLYPDTDIAVALYRLSRRRLIRIEHGRVRIEPTETIEALQARLRRLLHDQGEPIG